MQKITVLEYKYSQCDKYQAPVNEQFGFDLSQFAIAYFPVLFSIVYNCCWLAVAFQKS